MKSSNCRDKSDHKPKCCKPVIQSSVSRRISEQIISGVNDLVPIKFDFFPVQKCINYDSDSGKFHIVKSGVYNVQYKGAVFLNSISGTPISSWNATGGIIVNDIILPFRPLFFTFDSGNNLGVVTTQSGSELFKLSKGDFIRFMAIGSVEYSEGEGNVIMANPSVSLQYVGNY